MSTDWHSVLELRVLEGPPRGTLKKSCLSAAWENLQKLLRSFSQVTGPHQVGGLGVFQVEVKEGSPYPPRAVASVRI